MIRGWPETCLGGLGKVSYIMSSGQIVQASSSRIKFTFAPVSGSMSIVLDPHSFVERVTLMQSSASRGHLHVESEFACSMLPVSAVSGTLAVAVTLLTLVSVPDSCCDEALSPAWEAVLLRHMWPKCPVLWHWKHFLSLAGHFSRSCLPLLQYPHVMSLNRDVGLSRLSSSLLWLRPRCCCQIIPPPCLPRPPRLRLRRRLAW